MAIPVFILAAGLGTRLRPLTEHLPKPLLPVGSHTAIQHILFRVGPVARWIVVNTHYRAKELAAALPSTVLVSREERILGTAGGLAKAGILLGPGDVLVWNGDILSSLDPAAVVQAHAGDAEATLAVAPLPRGEGNVGVDEAGRIVRLRRETSGEEVRGGSFLGIAVVGARLRDALPEEGCLVGDVYLPALRRGETLRAFDVTDADWSDIGTLPDYEAACFAWLAKRGLESYVDEKATVADTVTVRSSIVGAGARIVGSGQVERCIVWPDAEATAPLTSAIVTPWGVVPT